MNFNNIKYLFLITTLLVSSTTCSNKNCDNLSTQTCPVLKSFVVFDKTRTLHFKHVCSEANYQYEGNWQAYSFFESFHTYKMLVLGEVLVGWVKGPYDLQPGISFRMEKMRLSEMTDWTGDRLAFALRVENIRTKKQVTGDFANSFLHYIPGTSSPQLAEYIISDQGTLDWEQFMELKPNNSWPGTQENKQSGKIVIKTADINYPAEDYILYLVVQNLNTKEEIALQGPILINPQALLKNTPKPEARALTFKQTINPGQKGGLLDWISFGPRYKDCIYLRKKAKNEFDRRVSSY